jgi:hypothetical protein
VSDEILRDCFKSMGLDHVTPFHVRALDAYRVGLAALGWSGRPDAIQTARQRRPFGATIGPENEMLIAKLATRLRHDLAFRDVDHVFAVAIDEDNRRLIAKAKEAERAQRERQRTLEQEKQRRERRRALGLAP